MFDSMKENIINIPIQHTPSQAKEP